MSNSAEPSAFHQFLADLDGQGRLLRCYTQNIDGLESRAGLELGLPTKPASPRKAGSHTPRCIPLHGQLSTLHCPLCLTSVPLADHLPLPPHPLPCPTCDLSSSIRSALSERSRKTGYLRASVVLYGEEHPQGELIGSAVERDLKGSGKKGEKEGKVDLLLVAGTSLSIPGVKRIVKEMARALQSQSRGNLPKVIMLNREMPKGKEWEGVFDTFIAGDIQDFAALCSDPTFTQAPPTPTTTPRKRKVSSTPKKVATNNPYPTPSPTPTRKRPRTSDVESEAPITPTKRRVVKSLLIRPVYPPTPESLEKEKPDFSFECASPLSDRGRLLLVEEL
jgi:NAD-dependent SIR2 family protein deacetylase